MVSVLVASLLAGTPQTCRAAYEAVRYHDAISECTSALPAASRGQLPEVYRFLALAFSSQGDHEQAQRAFVSLLTLDPAATLAESYSPRLRADFDAARATGAGVPVKLDIQVAPPLQVGVPLEVSLSVDDGNAKPVTGLAFTAEGATQKLARDSELKITLPAPTEPGTREMHVSAYDGLGGMLAERSTTFEIAPLPKKSRLVSWKLWGALALVTGAAGVVCGVYSRLDASQVTAQHFGTDGNGLQQTSNTLAISADVGFGLAAVTAITALVLLIVSR